LSVSNADPLADGEVTIILHCVERSRLSTLYEFTESIADTTAARVRVQHVPGKCRAVLVEVSARRQFSNAQTTIGESDAERMLVPRVDNAELDAKLIRSIDTFSMTGDSTLDVRLGDHAPDELHYMIICEERVHKLLRQSIKQSIGCR